MGFSISPAYQTSFSSHVIIEKPTQHALYSSANHYKTLLKGYQKAVQNNPKLRDEFLKEAVYQQGSPNQITIYKWELPGTLKQIAIDLNLSDLPNGNLDQVAIFYDKHLEQGHILTEEDAIWSHFLINKQWRRNPDPLVTHQLLPSQATDADINKLLAQALGSTDPEHSWFGTLSPKDSKFIFEIPPTIGKQEKEKIRDAFRTTSSLKRIIQVIFAFIGLH